MVVQVRALPFGNLGFTLLLRLWQLLQLSLISFENRLERWRRGQHLRAGPGFSRSATPRSMNQSDGNFQTLVKLASKEISHGGKMGDLLRSRDHPATLHIVQPRRGGFLCYCEQPNL